MGSYDARNTMIVDDPKKNMFAMIKGTILLQNLILVIMKMIAHTC